MKLIAMYEPVQEKAEYLNEIVILMEGLHLGFLIGGYH